jgi:hypothetical protein
VTTASPADEARRWLRFAQDDLKVAEGAAVWETILDDLDRHGLDISAFR